MFMRSFPSVDWAVPGVGAGFRASINFFTCLCCASLNLDAQTWWSMLYCRYLSAKANSPLPAKTFTTSPNCCCVRLCSILMRSNSCCGFHPARHTIISTRSTVRVIKNNAGWLSSSINRNQWHKVIWTVTHLWH